jgi:hypothetical protein
VNDRSLTRITPRISTTCERRSLSQCHSRANGDGSWAESLWKTAHGRIPSEAGHLGYRRCTEADLTASPFGLRLPPLVPGLFWFRARVILLTADPTPRSERSSQPQTKLPAETRLASHPTRPKQRLAVPEQTLPFPPPEPPLLFPARSAEFHQHSPAEKRLYKRRERQRDRLRPQSPAGN